MFNSTVWRDTTPENAIDPQVFEPISGINLDENSGDEQDSLPSLPTSCTSNQVPTSWTSNQGINAHHSSGYCFRTMVFRYVFFTLAIPLVVMVVVVTIYGLSLLF